MPTVLVTGAAGFIGQHLSAALRTAMPEATIIGLDRRSDMSACDRQVVCDLGRPDIFQTIQALDPIDYVVHCAAQSHVHFSMARPDIYVIDNVLATSNLIQALASHPSLKRFLVVSSCEVYGNTHEPAAEDAKTQPRTPYAASKLAQEYFALSAIEHQRLPAVVARLFNNYGPNQQSNRLIPRLMQALERDCRFELTGDGSQVRDWIAVEDTCAALLAILLGDGVHVGDIFNVTREEAFSVTQIIDMCEAAADRSIMIHRSQKDIGHLEFSAGVGDKLRTVTGWRPQRDLASYIAATAKQTTAGSQAQ